MKTATIWKKDDDLVIAVIRSDKEIMRYSVFPDFETATKWSKLHADIIKIEREKKTKALIALGVFVSYTFTFFIGVYYSSSLRSFLWDLTNWSHTLSFLIDIIELVLLATTLTLFYIRWLQYKIELGSNFGHKFGRGR